MGGGSSARASDVTVRGSIPAPTDIAPFAGQDAFYTHPSAASDGTSVLVVWKAGPPQDGPDLFGTRVVDVLGVRVRASDGALLDGTPLVIARDVGLYAISTSPTTGRPSWSRGRTRGLRAPWACASPGSPRTTGRWRRRSRSPRGLRTFGPAGLACAPGTCLLGVVGMGDSADGRRFRADVAGCTRAHLGLDASRSDAAEPGARRRALRRGLRWDRLPRRVDPRGVVTHRARCPRHAGPRQRRRAARPDGRRRGPRRRLGRGERLARDCGGLGLPPDVERSPGQPRVRPANHAGTPRGWRRARWTWRRRARSCHADQRAALGGGAREKALVAYTRFARSFGGSDQLVARLVGWPRRLEAHSGTETQSSGLLS